MSTPTTCCNKSATFVTALFSISLEVITFMVLELSLKGKSILVDFIKIVSNLCISLLSWENKVICNNKNGITNNLLRVILIVILI